MEFYIFSLSFENQFPVEGSDLRSEVLFCNISEALIDFSGKLHNNLSCEQFSVFAMREQFSNQELSAAQQIKMFLDQFLLFVLFIS